MVLARLDLTGLSWLDAELQRLVPDESAQKSAGQDPEP